MKQFTIQLLGVLFLAQLIACGGNTTSNDAGFDDTTPRVNQSPIADAGVDQTVNEQTAVTLAGSGTDSDGSITSYSWTQIEGIEVVLNDPNEATTTFNAPNVSDILTLTFELSVTDNEGATSTDSVIVSINPSVDSVFAGEDQTSFKGQVVNLSGSVEADGAIIKRIEWVQISGMDIVIVDSDKLNASFQPDFVEESIVTLKLIVTDSLNNNTEDTVDIMINQRNEIFVNDFDDQPNGGSLIIDTNQGYGDCVTGSWQYQMEDFISNNFQLDFDILSSHRSAQGSHHLKVFDGNKTYRISLPESFGFYKLTFILIANEVLILVNEEVQNNLLYSIDNHNTETNNLVVSYYANACGNDLFASAYFELDRLVVSYIGE